MKKIEVTGMHRFSSLYKSLTTSKNESYRARIIKKYFLEINADEFIPILRILLGYKVSPIVSIKKLITWCLIHDHIPEWMLKKCHATVGDWVETLSLVLGKSNISDTPDITLAELLKKIDGFRKSKNESELESWLIKEWEIRSPDELYLIHKLMVGNLKAMIQRQTLANILHELLGTDAALLRHRMNDLSTIDYSFERFTDNRWSQDELKSKPYPYTQPEVILRSSFHFGNPEEWIAERVLHGTRMQIHRSVSTVKVSNMEHEIIPPEAYPWMSDLFLLPGDTVIEILIAEGHVPDCFILDVHRWEETERSQLGSLLDRKKIINEWLEFHQIKNVLLTSYVHFSRFTDEVQLASGESWIIRNIHDARQYRIKPEARTVDTTLMYVEYINQNTAIQYQITLGVYDADGQLIPLTKLSADLMAETDKNELHYWIQNNTVQKFGPVRVVRPGKLVRISYERIKKNKRVKSGISLINVTIIKIINASAGVSSISSLLDIR